MSHGHGTLPDGTPEEHLPHGSIWPFFMGGAIALIGLGIITFGRNLRLSNSDDVLQQAASNLPLGIGLLAAGLLFLAIVLVGWIREDISWWKQNLGTGLGMARAGTLLFISSEVFIFGALFSSYFTFQRMADVWPDITLHHGHFPLPIGTTAMFTVFLFASSWTIHKAEGHLRGGNKKGFDNWLLATIVLGLIFLAGQVLEYYNLIHEGHTLGSSQFMTNFYMLTGTHGLHVFGGLMALIIALIRSKKGNFDEHRHAYVESVALYWHFVDLVWVFVFSVLYLIPKYVLGA